MSSLLARPASILAQNSRLIPGLAYPSAHVFAPHYCELSCSLVFFLPQQLNNKQLSTSTTMLDSRRRFYDD